MALSTTTIIQTIYPQLYNDPLRDNYIEIAKMTCSRCFYKDRFNFAVALTACHNYALSKRNLGESGAITGKREGNLSLSFAEAGGGENLDQTHYGKQLKELIHGGVPSILVNEFPSECGGG